MIESYKHYVGKPDLDIGSLYYDGVEYLPYVIIKNVHHKKLTKHFFYFHHDIPEDGRTIDELLNFIGGESIENPSTSSPAPAPTPKIKKKRKKTKLSSSNLAREKSDSISEEVSAEVAVDEASAVEVVEEPPEAPYKLEKSSTEQMKKIWKEFTEKNPSQKIFEASREFDFDITEEEGGEYHSLIFVSDNI